MLKLEGVETWYGAIQAIKGISLDVSQGEIVALLGANGAGKSTTIKTITGLLKAAKGRIEFMGKDITGMEAEDIAEIGIACVPEGRRIFKPLFRRFFSKTAARRVRRWRKGSRAGSYQTPERPILRAHVVLRSRFAEDGLAAAVHGRAPKRTRPGRPTHEVENAR